MESDDSEDIFGTAADVESKGKKSSPAKKNGLIILLDASKSMYDGFKTENEEETETGMKIALKIAFGILLAKVYHYNAQVSVVFFNANITKNAQGQEKVYELLPLERRKNQDIRDFYQKYIKIQNCLNKLCMEIHGCNVESFLKLDSNENNDDDIRSGLDLALWMSSVVFADKKFKPEDDKMIWIITNNINQFKDNDLSDFLFSQLRNRKEEMEENGVQLGLIPILQPETTFSRSEADGMIDSLFLPKDINPINLNSSVTSFLNLIRKKIGPRRVISRCPLILSPKNTEQIELPVNVRSLFSSAIKPTPARISKATNEILKSERKWISEETAEYISEENGDMLYAVEYGGRRVFLSKNKVNDLIGHGETASIGIRALGFEDLALLENPIYNLKHHYFAELDSQVEEQVILFVNLLRKMSERKMLMVAEIVLHKRSIPRLAYLWAQDQIIEKDELVQPAGLYVCYIPYCQDVRKIPLDKISEGSSNFPSRAQQDAIEKFVNALSVQNEYNPKYYLNPTISKHFAGLETLAFGLNNEWIPDNFDNIVPDDELFSSNELKSATELMISVFEDDINEFRILKRSGAQNTNPSRKSRKLKDITTMPIEQLRVETESGSIKLQSYPMGDLKIVLENFELKRGGRKNELISRLLDFLGNSDKKV